jgi:putative transposase
MELRNVYGGVRKRDWKQLTSVAVLIGHPERGRIEERVKVIEFFDKHGAKVTKEAFGVGRSTVYRWKKTLKAGRGWLVSLAPQSRKPHRVRMRTVDLLVKRCIISYRQEHPNVGQEAIKPHLDRYCRIHRLKTISVASIGRVISDLKKTGELADSKSRVSSFNAMTGKLTYRRWKRQKKLRSKGYVPQEAGGLVQIDSITHFAAGIKKYLITAVDVNTRFAFACAYPRLSSLAAKDFMGKLLAVTPFKIDRIQTDNGSEFEKYFREYVADNKIIHYNTYPKHPQSNGYIERFNRTIQEQYVHNNEHRLDNLSDFNQGLMEYLIWYNTEKPHRGLRLQTPLDYWIKSSSFNIQKSHMYRYRTLR